MLKHNPRGPVVGWSPDRPNSRTRKCVTYKLVRLTDAWAGRETANNCWIVMLKHNPRDSLG